MKTNSNWIASLAIIGLFSVITANAQVASGPPYALEQAVIAGGGGESASAGIYTIEGTIGQSIAGASASNNPFTVQSGFWTAPPMAPTASTVTVTGRVLTPDGRGLTNARVTLTDTFGGVRSALTGGFGYFTFTEVESGQMYVFSVISKRFEFAPQVLMVMNDIENLDFFGMMMRSR